MFSVCVFACAFVCVFGPAVVCSVLSVLWAMLPEIKSLFIHSLSRVCNLMARIMLYTVLVYFCLKLIELW